MERLVGTAALGDHTQLILDRSAQVRLTMYWHVSKGTGPIPSAPGTATRHLAEQGRKDWEAGSDNVALPPHFSVRLRDRLPTQGKSRFTRLPDARHSSREPRLSRQDAVRVRSPRSELLLPAPS